MHDTAGASLERPVTGAGSLEREFEERLADCGTLAFRVAYGVLRHREDAEDVAQEALAKAYRNLGTLRDRERFRAWLVRIAWRMALDRRRSAKRRERRELAAVETAPAPDAEQLAAASEFQARLWRAIDALPEDLRMVVVLSGIQGYDTGEVAGLLELPDGTVKSRLYRARKRLAEVLR
jgi:RNA polymerase sigma-70 factor, ECF subfamily